MGIIAFRYVCVLISSSLGLVWLIDAALLACDISRPRLNWLLLLRLEDLVGVGNPVGRWLWLGLANVSPR